MSEAVGEPVPSGAPDEAPIDSFEALYRRSFRRVYAYVASTLRAPPSRWPPAIAGS